MVSGLWYPGFKRARAEADRRKDELLATLAHELRNPLAVLGSGAQALRMAQRHGVSGNEATLVGLTEAMDAEHTAAGSDIRAFYPARPRCPPTPPPAWRCSCASPGTRSTLPMTAYDHHLNKPMLLATVEDLMTRRG